MSGRWLSLAGVLPLLLVIGCKQADLNQIVDVLQNQSSQLDQKTVVAGLKQALDIGTQQSVTKVSQVGGFEQDPLIKIGLPDSMQKLASHLRQFGYSSYVDQFEKQMNRSAEVASAQAKTLFIESISQMSVADAWKILKGPDNAATQYFRQSMEPQLKVKFKPMIAQSMSQVGIYNQYRKLDNLYRSLRSTNQPSLDLEEYILQKTLDGLFLKVADEEKKIRRDPAARVTELLQRVFAQQ